MPSAADPNVSASKPKRIRETCIFEPILINEESGERFTTGYVYVSAPNDPTHLKEDDCFTIKDGRALDRDGNPLLMAADVGFGLLHSWTKLPQARLDDAAATFPLRVELSIAQATNREVRIKCHCIIETVTTIVYIRSTRHPNRPIPPPIPALRGVGGNAISFRAALKIDADGAPKAYHATDPNKGLDILGNAVGLITDSNGNRVQHNIPPDGFFFVSPTSLKIRGFARDDPRHYIDASKIPYIALPPELWQGGFGINFGDYATVYWEHSKKIVHAILAEGGPHHKAGEGSIALAKALGVPNPSPVDGGVDQRELIYIVYPGSGSADANFVLDADAASAETIAERGARLFDDWGGKGRLHCCFPSGAQPVITEFHDDWA